MLSTPPKCLSSSSFDHCDKKILSQQKIVRTGVQGWGLASDDSQISHVQDLDQKLTSHEIQSSLLLLYFFCLFRILDLHAVMLWTFKGVVTQSWAEFLCRVESLQEDNLKGGTNNREMKWQHKVATWFDSEMDKPDKEQTF